MGYWKNASGMMPGGCTNPSNSHQPFCDTVAGYERLFDEARRILSGEKPYRGTGTFRLGRFEITGTLDTTGGGVKIDVSAKQKY